MIEIKHRYTGNVMLEIESLRGANLNGANLNGANLNGADLNGADLNGADLNGADLNGASLSGANLSGANLRGANLCGADLREADLSGADLRRASLSEADLSEADLEVIRQDLHSKLKLAVHEVPGLLKAVQEGKIDGSAYEGSCACFVGTIANIRGVSYDYIPGLNPDSSSPTERWFLAIKPGDTPENSQISAIIAQWIEEFQASLLPEG